MFVVKKSEAATDDPSHVTIEVESVAKKSETVNQGDAKCCVQVSESIASIEVPGNDSCREMVIRGEDGSVSIVTEIRTEEHGDQVDQVKSDTGAQPANSSIELSEDLILRIVESATTCVSTDSGTEYQTVSYTNATSQDCSYLDSSTGVVFIQEFVSEDAVDTGQADGHSELHDAVANISEHVNSDKVRDILVVNDVRTLHDDQRNSGETFQVYSSQPAKGSERFEMETCSDMGGAFKNYPVYPYELSTKPKTVYLKDSEKKKSTVLPPSNYSLVKKFSPEDLRAMGKTEDDIIYGYSEMSRKRRMNALAKERSKDNENVTDEGNSKPNGKKMDVDSSRENLNEQSEDGNIGDENENFGFENDDDQESCSTVNMNKDIQTVKSNTNNNKRRVADEIKEADKEYSPKKKKIKKHNFMTESSPNFDITTTGMRMGDNEAIGDFTSLSLPTDHSGETEGNIPIKIEDESDVEDYMEMNYWSNICKCFHYPDRCVIKIAPILRKMVKNRECVIEVDIEDTLSVGPFQKDHSFGGLSKYCVSITKPTETTYGTQNVNKAGIIGKTKLKTRIRKKKYRKNEDKSLKGPSGENVSENANAITDSGINMKTMEEDLILNVTTNPSDSPDEIENDIEIDVADDDYTAETNENTNNELPTEALPNAPVIFTSDINETESYQNPMKIKTIKRKQSHSKKRITSILKAKTNTQKTLQHQADVVKQNVSEGIDMKDFEVPPVVLLEKLPSSAFQNESGLRQRSKRQIKKVKPMSPDDFDKRLNPPKNTMEKDKTTRTGSQKKAKNVPIQKERENNASLMEVKQNNASISEVQKSNASPSDVKESDESQNDVKESNVSPKDMQEISESPMNIEESNESPKDMEESQGSLKDMEESNGSPKSSKKKPKRKKKKKGESKPRAEKKYTVTINADGVRLFECPICGYSSRYSQNTLKHMVDHTTDRNFICDQCGATFKSRHALMGHVIVHQTERPYPCPLCPQTFKRRRIFRCLQCDFSSKCSRYMSVHNNQHSGERPYQCEICGSTFKNPSSLTSHRRHHFDKVYYKCEFCGRGFKDLSCYKQHYRRHTGIKNHACDQCDYTCITSSELKLHKRKHTGEKPYECDLCGKGFISSGTLQRHRNQHTKEHVFSCGLCKSTYTRRDLCVYHVKQKHPYVADTVKISKVLKSELWK